MTENEQALRLTLTTAIEVWIEQQCKESEWENIGHITHDTMAEDMADAAFCIFQAVVKSQRYCIDEGLMKMV